MSTEYPLTLLRRRRTLAFYLKRLAHRGHSNNLHVTDHRWLFKLLDSKVKVPFGSNLVLWDTFLATRYY